MKEKLSSTSPNANEVETRFFGGQHGLDLGAQVGVITAMFGQKRAALVGREPARFQKHLGDALMALGFSHRTTNLQHKKRKATTNWTIVRSTCWLTAEGAVATRLGRYANRP